MRFALSAILSIQASRRLLLPVDVLISSIVNMAFSNKQEEMRVELGSRLSPFLN